MWSDRDGWRQCLPWEVPRFYFLFGKPIEAGEREREREREKGREKEREREREKE